jgi:HPt (histidine-containing phosphotransfer) domain-containing protein
MGRAAWSGRRAPERVNEELMERRNVVRLGDDRSPVQQPVLDPDTLAELRDLLGQDEPEALRDLLDVFLADTERRLATLREAVLAMETATIALTAHALKGSCATFGAVPLARLGAQIETEARVGNRAASEDLLVQIEAEYLRVRAALRRELSPG